MYIRRETYIISLRVFNETFIRVFKKSFIRVLIRNEMVGMWVLDTLYSLLGNWLRDHTSWALVELEWRLKVFPSTSNILVLNFTAPKYTFFFLNSETYIIHVINCEWSRFVNFSIAYVLYAIQTCIFPTVVTIWLLMNPNFLIRRY